MAEFTLTEVIIAINGKTDQTESLVFSGVSTDTRTIQPGNLFIALTGERFNGHDYLASAVEKGAAGVVISDINVQIPVGAASILVKDTRRALQDLARFHRQRFAIPIIAITGSNGKTTTKDMVAAVLESKLITLKTQANYNNEIGLPQTLLRLENRHQAAVVEMGMRGLGEIKELAAIALPSIGVVTTVGETHIELLGSVENIANAKAELVESIEAGGTVILNADNPHVRAMSRKTQAKTVLFGLEGGDITARNLSQTDNGVQFECCWTGEPFHVELPTFGRHNVYNALAAIAVGIELGLTPEEIRQGLNNFVPSGMRLHVETIAPFRIINDAYNASPLSMAASIEALHDIAKGRAIAVLGDMLELGDYAVSAHQQVGKQLIKQKIDLVITVGPLANYIASTVQSAGGNAIACENHDEAKHALRELLQPGDTVLLKGSRGMRMEQLMDVFR